MQYVVAVRALCEFTAKQGDLDLRFTPSPSALEGIAGHQLVSARRGAGYQSEVSLQAQHGPLLVRGRADGYLAAQQRLEEIKTHRGDLSRQPANQRHLHWAQLKVYGHLLCQSQGLAALTLALVYLDVGSQQETVLAEAHSAEALRTFFDDQCGRFLAWAQQEWAHRGARDRALETLAFPHAAFHPGQRELATAVYRAAVSGRCLLAQAPTGIGKTVGTLFPLLKASPGQAIDKIFYLAAKTPGRQLALDALQRIASAASASPSTSASESKSTPALPLRILELTARDKACEHPDRACHGASCPLANGFYDRLGAARVEAVNAGAMDRPALRALALRHQVCPYYLGQELVRWADVVVGDYNYYFDASAMLYAMAAAGDWRVGVLVDEAHNLIERARSMYTAELRRTDLRALRVAAPAALQKLLNKVDRCWRELVKDQTDPYAAHDALPDSLTKALQQLASAMADQLADAADTVPDGPLQQFHFNLLGFLRLAEAFGEHSLFDITLNGTGAKASPGRARPDSTLCIRNLIPAPFLAPRMQAARSVTLFSATLAPTDFYRDTLGLPPDTASVDVASPFAPEQLAVHLVSHISTRFADRQRSAAPIAELIARQYQARPGNYLAFFSSHDYLQLVAPLFSERHPDIPVWQQTRQMDEAARADFLAHFESGGRGIGFAVLGGSFGEGIDLPGDRLVGAFIATLGLPQTNAVNEEIRRRMQAAFGAGYDYTYLFPGLRKVVQAAGRVVRTPQDRGVVYLIDDRYARPAVRALLPGWWRITR